MGGETVKSDLAPLESSFAMSIVLYVRDHPGCTKNEVVGAFGKCPRTILARILRLTMTGVIEVVVDMDDTGFRSGLRLSPGGERIAERISDLRDEFVRHREEVFAELSESEGRP